MITKVNFDASKNNSCTSSQPENKQTNKETHVSFITEGERQKNKRKHIFCR